MPMNHNDKYISRPGNFIMTGSADTNSINSNVIGSGAAFWAIEVIEAAIFSNLEDNGATALGNGTANTNNGVNFAAGVSVPAGVMLVCSTEQGFTRIAISSGTIVVHRLKDLMG